MKIIYLESSAPKTVQRGVNGDKKLCNSKFNSAPMLCSRVQEVCLNVVEVGVGG